MFSYAVTKIIHKQVLKPLLAKVYISGQCPISSSLSYQLNFKYMLAELPIAHLRNIRIPRPTDIPIIHCPLHYTEIIAICGVRCLIYR